MEMNDALSHYFCYNYSTGKKYTDSGLVERGRLYIEFSLLHDIIKDLVILDLIEELNEAKRQCGSLDRLQDPEFSRVREGEQ